MPSRDPGVVRRRSLVSELAACPASGPGRRIDPTDHQSAFLQRPGPFCFVTTLSGCKESCSDARRGLMPPNIRCDFTFPTGREHARRHRYERAAWRVLGCTKHLLFYIIFFGFDVNCSALHWIPNNNNLGLFQKEIRSKT